VWAFLVTAAARGLVEWLGVTSENAYHTAAPWRAAISAAACVAVGVPITRSVVADGSDVSAAAVVLVAGVGAFFGCRSLERRKAGR